MSTRNEPQTPKEALQQLNTLFMALLAGQVLLFFALFFTQSSFDQIIFSVTIETLMNPVLLAGSIIAISAVALSFFIYNKRKVEGAALSGGMMEKLHHYRQTLIIRMALIEGANLMMVMLYFFLSPQVLLLFYFVLGLFLFVQTRPTVDLISQDYQLSGAEQNELRSTNL